MNPYYDELPMMGGEEELIAVMGVILAVFGVIALFLLAFALLRSWCLYSIAKRRGISKAWLAWIPIGKDWVLGSLSDQYQHLALGQIKSRRKILMVLNLAFALVTFASFGLSVATALAEFNGAESAVALNLMGMIPSLLNAAISVAGLIFYHICNYDLYRSCDPKNAVVYLVVAIVIPITEPFFYLAVRKRDEGMSQPQITDTIL